MKVILKIGRIGTAVITETPYRPKRILCPSICSAGTFNFQVFLSQADSAVCTACSGSLKGEVTECLKACSGGIPRQFPNLHQPHRFLSGALAPPHELNNRRNRILRRRNQSLKHPLRRKRNSRPIPEELKIASSSSLSQL